MLRSSIRVGEPRRGVNYLSTSSLTSIQVNKVLSYDVWHRRLWHPSSQALFKFSSNSNPTAKNDLCDLCLRAKQTRNPSLLSENKAKNCFDLIHCDIWGPYHVKSFSGAHCPIFSTILDDASPGV